MKIILQKKVPGVGETGDIKEVSEGYARNFLFPRQLAILATAETLLRRQQVLDRAVKEKVQNESGVEKLVRALNGMTLTIPAKTNEAGLLYAAVGPAIIADVLQKKGFTVPAEKIIVPDPIKKLGKFAVEVVPRSGLVAHITLRIIAS